MNNNFNRGTRLFENLHQGTQGYPYIPLIHFVLKDNWNCDGVNSRRVRHLINWSIRETIYLNDDVNRKFGANGAF